MSEPGRSLGVGVISFGWMGRLHTRSYEAVGRHFPDLAVRPRLVSVADPVAAVAAAAVDVYGYATSTPDYRELLADPAVDVVSICSPNFLHREMAVAAAAAGKPFWIEKPMGRGVGESADVARAAAAAGIVTCVGFNYRHAPAIAHARELVRTGRLGRVTNVAVRLLADYSSDPDGAFTWRFERDRAGSGVLGDLLSHGFDLAQFVVAPIAEVSALTETFIPRRPRPTSEAVSHFSAAAGGELTDVENEDYAAVLARFADGAVGTFESSRAAVGPRVQYSLEVYGTEGSLRWDFQRLGELEVCLGRGGREHGYTTVFASPGHGEFGRFQPGGGVPMSFDDLKVVEAKLFLESVLTGQQLAPSAADGWAAAAIADAAERSAASRAWEAVPAVEGPTTTGA